MIAENIKRGTGQKVLEGGLALLAYKVLVNEVAPQNEWFQEQFGADEFEMLGADDDYEAIFGADDDYTEGDAYLADDGETYILGTDGRWYPVSEQHRQISADEDDLLGGPLQQPGHLGGQLRPPGRLGEMAVYPPEGRYKDDPFMRAYDGRG
jgi:hypothetical protein